MKEIQGSPLSCQGCSAHGKWVTFYEFTGVGLDFGIWDVRENSVSFRLRDASSLRAALFRDFSSAILRDSVQSRRV